MKKLALLFAFFCLSGAINAQGGVLQPGDYRDGVYDKENSVNRVYIPYTFLREGDVMWEKRVWRRLDMREKINQVLYYPKEINVSRKSLLQVVIKALMTDQIKAFSDEQFLELKDKESFRKSLVIQEDSADVELLDENNQPYTVRQPGPIDSLWIYENFSSVVLKEDWFFDRQRSVLEVRIIGMEFFATKKGKEEAGEFSQFVLYFPECRPLFAKNEVFNVSNDAERRTLEDVFWKRQFASTIIKESNVYDREIEQYAKGIDKLLESDRVKYDIFKLEHDLWQF